MVMESIILIRWNPCHVACCLPCCVFPRSSPSLNPPGHQASDAETFSYYPPPDKLSVSKYQKLIRQRAVKAAAALQAQKPLQKLQVSESALPQCPRHPNDLHYHNAPFTIIVSNRAFWGLCTYTCGTPISLSGLPGTPCLPPHATNRARPRLPLQSRLFPPRSPSAAPYIFRHLKGHRPRCVAHGGGADCAG